MGVSRRWLPTTPGARGLGSRAGPPPRHVVVVWYTLLPVAERFDPDGLEEDPFEVDAQAAHLFKHPNLGLQDVYDVWVSDPLFYPARPPAHWLMCADVAGRVLVVPLTPARDANPGRCRPIGCYEASPGLAAQYRRDQ